MMKRNRQHRSAQQRRHWFASALLYAAVALLLAIALGVLSPANAQVSLPSAASDPTRPPASVERVGNLEWGIVRFEGRSLFAVTARTVRDRSNPGDLVPVEDRISAIQSNLRWVIAGNPAERQTSGLIQRWQVNPLLDPATLRVERRSLPAGTVLTASDDSSSEPLPLLTVTPLDAQFHRRTVSQLAQEWQALLQQELTRAVQLRQPEALQRKVHTAWAIALLMAISGFLLWLVQRWLRYRRSRLQSCHKATKTALRTDVTYAATAVSSGDAAYKPSTDGNSNAAVRGNTKLGNSSLRDSERSPGSTNSLMQSIASDFRPMPLPWFQSLTRSFTLERRLSAVTFFQWLAFWGQILIWLGGIVLIVSQFPGTRTLTESIWLKPLRLLIIWFVVGLLDRLGDVLINGLSDAWRENDLFTFEEVQRRSLRISTIVTAVKGLKTFLIYLLGLGWAFSILGLPVGSVLTFGAVLAFAASLASQNLIRDLVNGFLIISEDQYAIGDVVTIGNSSGLVENMNLRVTQLRNGDGRLITIPNSMIDRVENQTRLWSRVDLLITVAYDSDIEQVLSVIRDVAQSLYEDPAWGEKFYSPPQVLGVETLSHEGISIRVWLDTQPMQQFAVGREFRLRMRLAFEQNNINIGMPQQLFRSSTEHEDSAHHDYGQHRGETISKVLDSDADEKPQPEANSKRSEE